MCRRIWATFDEKYMVSGLSGLFVGLVNLFLMISQDLDCNNKFVMLICLLMAIVSPVVGNLI